MEEEGALEANLETLLPPRGETTIVPTFHMSKQAQTGEVTGLRSHSKWESELGWEPRVLEP